MDVNLTPDQESFIRRGIEDGRFQNAESAVKAALSQWEERERIRAEILAAVDRADASLARGEGRVITSESVQSLAEDVKQRGRARLAEKQSSIR